MANGYHIDTNLGYFSLIEVVKNCTKIFNIKNHGIQGGRWEEGSRYLLSAALVLLGVIRAALGE